MWHKRNRLLNLMEQTKLLVETITKGIQEKKGKNITIVDLRDIEANIVNYFIICQGNSPTQVEAITESVDDIVKQNIVESHVNVVGLGNDQWVALDYVDVFVHIFQPEFRAFYDLESLWQDAKLTKIPNLNE